jgi:hypothetical protein
MTALSITTSQLLPVSGPTVTGVIGAALAAGSAVYFDTTTGKWEGGPMRRLGRRGGRGRLWPHPRHHRRRRPEMLDRAARRGRHPGCGRGSAGGTVYAFAAAAGSLAPVADMVSTNKVTPFALGIGSNKVKLLAGAYDAGAVVP